jgi:hypothetical protein
MAMKPASYDPETIKTLQRALDLAWDALPAERRLRTSRVALAGRILTVAAKGERDLARLKAAAIIELVPADQPPELPSPPLQPNGTAA